MPKVPDGFVHVRSHNRRKPGPKSAKGMSFWAVAGVCALVWLWGQIFGFGDSSTEQQPAPIPAASVPAGGQ